MKRSDAEYKHSQGYKSIEGQNCLSYFQQAETLEEINQKTLTIRDQFAIAAMQSLIAVYPVAEYESATSERLARCQAETAYQIADVMIEVRNK